MIIFDGKALESIAPIKIDDIHVSPVTYNPIARERAIRAGAEYVRMRKGTRQIRITFAIQEQNRINRHEMLLAVNAWAKSDKEYILELPQDPNRYLECVCTQKPDPSLRQWWEAKLTLVFTCFENPFWTDKGEKSVACGTQFVVNGDDIPFMRIERTLSSAASNQSYSDGTNTMTFSSIPSGDMVIDLNKQTAQVGTTDIMQYLNPSGLFIEPRLVVQTITGTGTVKYRERRE